MTDLSMWCRDSRKKFPRSPKRFRFIFSVFFYFPISQSILILFWKQKVKKHDSELLEAIKAIASTMSGVREQAKVAEEEIHRATEHLIATVTVMLRDREAALIGDVEATRHQKEKELQLQKDGLEFLLSGLRQAVLFGEAIVKEGSDTEIVAGHQQVVARLVTLTKTREEAQLEPVIGPEIEFVGEDEEGLKTLGSVIQDLGTVVVKDVSSVLSTIEKPAGTNHMVSKAYSFKVTLVDKKGQRVSSTVAEMNKVVKNLAIEVIGPSEAKVRHID